MVIPSESVQRISTVPFFSTRRRDEELSEAIHDAIRGVISSGIFVGGPQVEKFESKWASYCGVDTSIGVGNGLDALALILRGLDIGPGDEVVVPAFTFIATWIAVMEVGATPVPVDVDLETGLLDSGAALAAISPKTAAIIPVHLFGQRWRSQPLEDACRRDGIHVIHDAAQAHGLGCIAEGRRDHHWAYSFYPTKNLGALGDGGAVCTNDVRLAERIRALRSYGAGKEQYNYTEVGLNSRLDPMQAAVLTVFLSRLDSWNAQRRNVASEYLDQVSGIQGVTALKVEELGDSVWHHFVLRVSNRNHFRGEFLRQGVETRIHYPQAISAIPAIKQRLGKASRTWDFPNARSLADQCVSLPMHPWLGSDAKVCANVLHRYCEGQFKDQP